MKNKKILARLLVILLLAVLTLNTFASDEVKNTLTKKQQEVYDKLSEEDKALYDKVIKVEAEKG